MSPEPEGLGDYVVKFDVSKPSGQTGYFQFELSCCRSGHHSFHTWGWPGESKIILLEGDNETYSDAIIALVTKQAALICKLLNRKS